MVHMNLLRLTLSVHMHHFDPRRFSLMRLTWGGAIWCRGCSTVVPMQPSAKAERSGCHSWSPLRNLPLALRLSVRIPRSKLFEDESILPVGYCITHCQRSPVCEKQWGMCASVIQHVTWVTEPFVPPHAPWVCFAGALFAAHAEIDRQVGMVLSSGTVARDVMTHVVVRLAREKWRDPSDSVSTVLHVRGCRHGPPHTVCVDSLHGLLHVLFRRALRDCKHCGDGACVALLRIFCDCMLGGGQRVSHRRAVRDYCSAPRTCHARGGPRDAAARQSPGEVGLS